MTTQPPTVSSLPAGMQHRYELLEEIPHVTRGRLFRARDLAFGEIVGFKQFGPGWGLAPDERRQMEDTVRHLQGLPHPHLVQFHSFDAETGVLVQDWVEGLSMLDLLRRRRQLSTSEVLTLLASLPATLDFLAEAGVPIPRPLLNKLFVQFADPDAAARFGALPVDQWPAFTLRLNAFCRRARIPATALEDSTDTVIADAHQVGDLIEKGGPREFARLLYELLGGRVRELDPRRYSPIGALREAGNAVLQRTLLEPPPLDCQTLWKELLAAQPELHRASPPSPAPTFIPRNPLRIPPSFLSTAQPGVALLAQPLDPKDTPIRLVARPRFQLGRSKQQSDYLARFQPENESNQMLTNRLGRVHAHLEIGPAGLQVRDGNGTGPSLNGTSLDGRPLPSDVPTPLPARSLLYLGEEYALELIHVAPVNPHPVEIANFDGWTGPRAAPRPGPAGALICLSAHGQTVAQHTAWFFSEAGFGLTPSSDFFWNTRDRHVSPAAFYYHCGCFWLAHHAGSAGTLAIGGKTLEPGEIAPLSSGVTLRLGHATFTVLIE